MTTQHDSGGITLTLESIKLGSTKPGEAGTELTATAAELNAAADVSGRFVTIADATTYTLLAADSGKLHFWPDMTSTCTVALPVEAAGLEYTFLYGGGAADAQNFVLDSGSNTNFFVGGVAFLDIDAGQAADEVHAGVYSDGNSNSKFTVVKPSAGTRVTILCNGTTWYIGGIVVSDTIPTFADQ